MAQPGTQAPLISKAPQALQVPQEPQALHQLAPHILQLNWSRFIKFSGKLEEDAEAYLLRTND